MSHVSSARRVSVPARGALLAMAAAIVAGCLAPPAAKHADVLPNGRVEELDLAVTPGGQLLATWAIVDRDGGADIVLSRFDDTASEASWSRPRIVNDRAKSAVAGRQVGPRVAITPNGVIAVSWVDRRDDLAGDIFLAVSSDDGATFSSPTRVNDDVHTASPPTVSGATALCGQEYHDMAVTRDGNICVVWLDERDAPSSNPNQKQLYFSLVSTDGRLLASNQRLTDSADGVCPCCVPSVTVGQDGSIHVIYRDRVGPSLFVRVLSRRPSQRSFDPAVTLSEGWTFSCCPVNGPAIAAADDGTLWAMWVAGGSDGQLWWSRSRDGGRTFDAPTLVESTDPSLVANASHIRLAPSTNMAVATWETGDGQIGYLRLGSGAANADSVTPKRLARTSLLLARSPVGQFTQRDAVASICWIEAAVVGPHGLELTDAPSLPVLAWLHASD